MTIESKLDQIVECLQKLVDAATGPDEVVRYGEVAGSNENASYGFSERFFFNQGVEEGRRQAGKRERVVFTSVDLEECIVDSPYLRNWAHELVLVREIQRWLDTKVNV